MSTITYAFNTAGIVSILVGTILPLVVALVGKTTWPRDLKGVFLLVLAGISSVLSQFLQANADSTRFDWKGVVLTAAVTFLTALGTYFGIWKNGKVQAKLLAVGGPKA